MIDNVEWAPFDLVIFDCDSTLTSIEGIDELARWHDRADDVAALTTRAMNGEIPLEAVYSERLEMLKPTREQLRQLGQLYRRNLLPGADQVIAALLAADRQVFIVSGGLAEAVMDFGVSLDVPVDHIYAVGTAYDELSGRWWERWKHPRGQNPDERYLAHDAGPLTLGGGKTDIIRALRAEHRGRAMLVGDGNSDLEASIAVDLFVGFAGVVARERVASAAEVLIGTPSLAPVLPLAFGPNAVPPGYAGLYQAGADSIRQAQVAFRDSRFRQALLERLA